MLKTLAGLIVSTVLVRLILIAILPDLVATYEAEQALNRAELSTVIEEVMK